MTGRVRPGDPMRISAADWNRVLDAVDAVESSGFLFRPGSSPAVGSIIYVKNVTSTTVFPGEILALSHVETPPREDRMNGIYQPVIAGTTPSRNRETIAVALEVIEAGRIGCCIVSGVALAKVTSSERPYFAKWVVGSNRLQLGSEGDFPVLWYDAGNGYALIDLSRDAFITEGELTSSLSCGGTATASTSSYGTITVSDIYARVGDWKLGSGPLPVGTKIVARWVHHRGWVLWFIRQCEESCSSCDVCDTAECADCSVCEPALDECSTCDSECPCDTPGCESCDCDTCEVECPCDTPGCESCDCDQCQWCEADAPCNKCDHDWCVHCDVEGCRVCDTDTGCAQCDPDAPCPQCDLDSECDVCDAEGCYHCDQDVCCQVCDGDTGCSACDPCDCESCQVCESDGTCTTCDTDSGACQYCDCDIGCRSCDVDSPCPYDQPGCGLCDVEGPGCWLCDSEGCRICDTESCYADYSCSVCDAECTCDGVCQLCDGCDCDACDCDACDTCDCDPCDNECPECPCDTVCDPCDGCDYCDACECDCDTCDSECPCDTVCDPCDGCDPCESRDPFEFCDADTCCQICDNEPL